MEENQGVRSKRDLHLERMRKKYPDKKFEDDEEIYGAISDDYDQYEDELGVLRGREKTLSDMMKTDPRSAQFLADMHNGRSPWANYIRIFGPELKDCIDKPEIAEQIAQAETEYMERVAKSKQLEQEYEGNIEQTFATLQQFQQERGLSDEQIDEVMAAAVGIVRDGVTGKFTPETLDMILKALNHDADVEAAGMEGEVAGRNARITESLRKSNKGDGIAPLNGKNSGAAPTEKRQRSIFDEAREAQ